MIGLRLGVGFQLAVEVEPPSVSASGSAISRHSPVAGSTSLPSQGSSMDRRHPVEPSITTGKRLGS